MTITESRLFSTEHVSHDTGAMDSPGSEFSDFH